MRFLSFGVLLIAPAAVFAAGLSFEVNQGQAGHSASFFARTTAGVVLLTREGVVLQPAGAHIRLELAGANPNARWEASEPTNETTSYYVGRDPSRWLQDVPHYRRLTRRNLYDGIDVTWYGNERGLEYDFLLAPHADPSRIRLRFRGAGKLAIRADGALLVDSEAVQGRPMLYETLPDGSRRNVSGAP